MASDDAKPSEYRCDDRGMRAQPRRRAFVPSRWSNFPFHVCRDACALPCRCLPARFRKSVETKTPPGEHRGGVIAARTRKGGSAFSRANCNNPGTKGTGGRFDSRLWNREFCSGRASPCDRKTGTRCSPAVNRRPARPQRRRGYGPNDIREFCGMPKAWFRCGSSRTSQSRAMTSRSVCE